MPQDVTIRIDSVEPNAPSRGGYHVLKKLAQGGMAEIFLARHHSMDGFQRNVVIKRILPEFSQDPEFVESFLNEARLSAQLNHPNIVQIYDLGRSEGCYYIAMEYVRGFDLSTLLLYYKRAALLLPVPVVFSIIRDVCMGLTYAHDAVDLDGQALGLIHRDVTPSNIIIGREGQAKLLDFGIAKAQARGEGTTKSGFIKGKFAYLAPEQVLSQPVDRRADIFSTGITLFQMLTNHNPFQGDSEYQTIQRVAQAKPPSALTYRADLPPGIDDVIQKALARDPAERFQTCAELWGALAEEASWQGLDVSHQTVQECLASCDQELDSLDKANKGSRSGESDLSGKILGVGSDAATERRFSEEPSTHFLTQWKKNGRSLWLLGLTGALAAAAIVTVFLLEARARGLGKVTPQSGGETGFEIVTSPAGCDVLLDGRLLTGHTPLTVADVTPGHDHVIEARLTGYAPTTSELKNVPPGMHLVQLALAPTRPPDGAKIVLAPTIVDRSRPRAVTDNHEPGHVQIIVLPWASVTVDGKKIGDTPMPPLTLAPGPHVMTLENSDIGKKTTKRFNVAPGQATTVRENFATAF